MVKVRIDGEDSRKDEDGIAHVSWSEAQAIVAAGNGEIVQSDPVEEDPSGGDHAGQEDRSGEPEGGYEKMTRAELDALADERGVDVTGARTKEDVIDRLRA